MDCCSRSHAVERNNAKDQKKKKVGERKSGKGVKLSTDVQSIAARERRHRISERFKILQSLVPGGSKMDTVSMLEEAIHYVKFLKTQIWLHHNMINFSDPNWLLMQNYISGQQQIITCSTDHSYAEPLNMVAEAHALPQLGFPHSGYSSYDEEILMAMPFDHAKMFH